VLLQQHMGLCITPKEIEIELEEAFAFSDTDSLRVEPFCFFIFCNLIHLSLLFIRVGISTGFPILMFPSALVVGCQRVSEPILSPLLDKLITHEVGN